MSAKLQRGCGWSKPLPSFHSKYCVIFFYCFDEVDNHFATEADTIIVIEYDLQTWIRIILEQ